MFNGNFQIKVTFQSEIKTFIICALGQTSLNNQEKKASCELGQKKLIIVLIND